MTNHSILIIDSLDSLKRNAETWNDLWQRSDATSPTLRAEMIELWMRRFAEDKPFRALVVEANTDGATRFVAALPLYVDHLFKILRVGRLPSNDWSYCGDLLLDTTCNRSDVLRLLLDALKLLPVDLLWLDPIRFELPRWNAFQEQLGRTNRKSQFLPRYQTAVVPLAGNREQIEASWKKSEIGNIRRRFKKHYLSDAYRFEMIDDAERIALLLPDCFVLENAGWKGTDGGSILNNGMDAYYLEQARRLAEQGLFRLFILYFEDKPIAFRYCFYAKNTVCSLKTSFDPSRRDLAPGQVLQWLISNCLIDDPQIEFFDFIGIAGKHQEIWNPELQVVGQCVLPVSCTGKLFFLAYDNIMPIIRRRRKRP